MIDISFIGKEGLIVQYEDIISLIGFNVIRYLKAKNICNNKVSGMSVNDILLSYINREEEDIGKWVSSFDIEFNISDYRESINMLQPNLIFAYKILDSGFKNGIRNLIIHSEIESNVIRKFIDTFNLPIKYTNGDIVPVLKTNVNSTYITSNENNIKKCLSLDSPMALTIVDDYLHLSSIVTELTTTSTNNKDNIYVGYISAITAGFI